jgi:putative endonuclease
MIRFQLSARHKILKCDWLNTTVDCRATQEATSHGIGQTQNLEMRLVKHNRGLSSYTRSYKPWNLVWYKQFDTRSEAFKLEQELKKIKSRLGIIKFITENPCVEGSENLQICDLLDFRESS